MFIILVQSYFFVFTHFVESSAPEVKIEQGLLRGKYDQTWKGRSFNAFTGIPYAKPPVDVLRFEVSVPATPWNGVLDASKPPAHCPQINVYINSFDVVGDEDCLYLNVYTPELSGSLPVMFYIHGGGLTTGGSNDYGPKILLDKDIVLVVINYRLGPLGFLSTGDDIVPGNNGLKDQSLALKWTKKNIASFGGDPEKITVFGQSAGGASTNYHMISPLSRDLLFAAIAQSGTVGGIWNLDLNGETAENSKKLAKFLNCPTTSSRNIVECLRRVSAYDIVAQDTKFLEWSYDPMIPFKPVIEPDTEGAFLIEHPLDTIMSGKAANISFMTGLNSEDGALKSAVIYNDTKLIKELDKDFIRLAPFLFSYHKMPIDKDSVSKKIREFYLKDKKIDESTRAEVTEMFTDGWFLMAEDRAVRWHLKFSKQPIFYYLFAYRGSFSYTTMFGDAGFNYGVCHCDELLYLFNYDLLNDVFKPTAKDRKMMDVMATLWTNFAKTGRPASDWKPISSNNLEYYYISDHATMANGLYQERAKFWRNLPINTRKDVFRIKL